MRHTLLLRLAGPMQAWGVQSRFSNRDTLMEPTKSGVVGLICAAMGVERSNTKRIQQIARLRMGVRVDREGVRHRDYHTAGKDSYLRASGSVERKNVIISERFYLTDAWFTVGLEGDDVELLEEIRCHLKKPCWPLWLGRKSMPPAAPVHIPNGLVSKPLEAVLSAFVDPYWKKVLNRKPPSPKRFIVETVGAEMNAPAKWGSPVTAPVRPDQPMDYEARRFAPRTVHVYVPESGHVPE